MSIKTQDFKEAIRERIQDEKNNVQLLNNSIKKINNQVVKLMFHQLALDSAKHGHMLDSILELLETSSTNISQIEGEEFRKLVKKHIEVENKMLESFEKIVDSTKDKRIRFILQEIISDEKKHHAITQRMNELIFEGEKVKDEKWWDFLFRYSRLKG